MAEELFQFLIKLKEDGVDLSSVSVFHFIGYDSRWRQLEDINYKEEFRELELS
jgi:hypothetical protein